MKQQANRPHKAWTLVIASLAVFMTALDALVVTTALPAIRVDLGASLSDLEWTVNSYNLSFACLLLTGAALGDRFGRRRMLALGLCVFTAASAAAALVPTADALVAARALQGAGAAIVMPLTLTLISAAFPAEKRGTAIGLWGGITGLAVAAGPVVGGAVVEGIDWQWIFWLNVPLGVALVPLASHKLTESFGPRPQLDVVGLVLAGLGALAITWGLVRTSSAGWSDREVIAGLVGGVLMLALFGAWERRTPSPMVPLDLFRSRGFCSANAVSFLMYAGLFGAVFLMSQMLQTALGYSPLRAGLALLPWTVTPMFVSPIAGALADRYGNRPFMVLGLGLQAGGYAWIAAIAGSDISYVELGAAFTVAGVGTSFCFPTVANAVMSSVSQEEAGVASGTNSALRELGGVFGVALLASAFAAHGGYESPAAFLSGFATPMWIAAALSGLGVVAAAFAPGRAPALTCAEPAPVGQARARA